MNSLITAAARALAAGDPLGALNRVALRDDPPALALRGIAMAQLGDLERARALLRRAGRAFGPREAVARARCVVAEAEIAFVSRDLGWPVAALEAARMVLERHGDRANAAHARYLGLRRLVLLGRLDEAERAVAELDPAPLPPASRAAHELVAAGIALRRLRTEAARAALGRAERAAQRGGDRGADGGGRECVAAPECARGATGRGRGGAAPAARRGRGAAVLGCVGRRCLPAPVRDRRHGGGAGTAPGPVRPRPHAGRGLARRCRARAARRARVRRQGGRRIASRPAAGRDRAAAPDAAAAGCHRATRRGFALAPRHAREVVVLAPPVGVQHAAVSHCSPTARPGRARPWRWRSAPASAPCSGRSTRSRPRVRCSRSAVAGRAAGSPPPVPGFPTVLLLPALCPATRVAA